MPVTNPVSETLTNLPSPPLCHHKVWPVSVLPSASLVVAVSWSVAPTAIVPPRGEMEILLTGDVGGGGVVELVGPVHAPQPIKVIGIASKTIKRGLRISLSFFLVMVLGRLPLIGECCDRGSSRSQDECGGGGRRRQRRTTRWSPKAGVSARCRPSKGRGEILAPRHGQPLDGHLTTRCESGNSLGPAKLARG